MQFYCVKIKAFLFCLNRKRGNDGGGLSVYCYFHWLIKRLPWPFDRTENQVGGVNRTECWEEGNEADAMEPATRSDMLNLSW